MCEFDNPDCLNCPYDECTATDSDIQRQWKHSKEYKVLDNPDNVPKKVGTHVKAIYIGTSYTEGVKRRQERYRKTEKGKENERRKMQRAIQNGKNAERCRRYRERKKAAKDHAEAMQIMQVPHGDTLSRCGSSL